MTGFIVASILAIASLIPIFPTWGRFKIGGDVILPLLPENLAHMTYQWIDTANGLYAANDYWFWINSFHLLKLLGLDVYQSAFLYQFLIYFLSGIGIYKIYNLFNKHNKLWGLAPAVAFIYSPHFLDHMIYFQATACIVWMMVILFRFIKTKKLTWYDPFLAAAIIPFIGNLPNPKYHFLIFFVYLLTLGGAYYFQLINWDNIKKTSHKLFAFLGMTAHIWLPFLYFGANFVVDENIQVNIRQGYRRTGVAIDYGGTFISKMITLFHTPNLNPSDIEIIYRAPFIFAFYALAILVLCGSIFLIAKNITKNRIIIIWYLLCIVLIFLAKSSNPPFGFGYEFMLSSAKVFAFMRTTAGIVIYAGVFFALLVGYVTQTTYRRHRSYEFLVLVFVILAYTSYPFWSGKYFLNQSPLNPFLDKSKHGIQLPQSYFDSAKFMAQSELDGKIRIYPGVSGYQNNTWGYYGFNLYPWLFKQSMVGVDPNDQMWASRNITNYRYILHDKSLFEENRSNKYEVTQPSHKIFSSREIDLYEVADDTYPAYIMVPEKITLMNRVPSTYFETNLPSREAVYIIDQPIEKLAKIPQASSDRPFVEYKRINPTKYRIRLHQANGTFPLVFHDAFHNKWKLYLNQNPEWIQSEQFSPRFSEIDRSNTISSIDAETYVQKGFLTNVKAKNPAFVSKNFSGTVQNNNLPNGAPWETWNMEAVDELNHLKVNRFANSWILETDTICSLSGVCRKTNNGYDIELIAEFYPQRIHIASVGLSIVSFFIYLGFVGYGYYKKRIKTA